VFRVFDEFESRARKLEPPPEEVEYGKCWHQLRYMESRACLQSLRAENPGNSFKQVLQMSLLLRTELGVEDASASEQNALLWSAAESTADVSSVTLESVSFDPHYLITSYRTLACGGGEPGVVNLFEYMLRVSWWLHRTQIVPWTLVSPFPTFMVMAYHRRPVPFHEAIGALSLSQVADEVERFLPLG
jgi:hypothetical protein